MAETVQPKYREIIKSFWVQPYKKGRLPKLSHLDNDRSHYVKAIRQLDLSDWIKIYQSNGWLYAEKGEYKYIRKMTEKDEAHIMKYGAIGSEYEGHEYRKGDKIKCRSLEDMMRVGLIFMVEGYKVGIAEYEDMKNCLLTITAEKGEGGSRLK